MSNASPSVAIIGAGIAGATAAQALARAGHAVQLFDKARGPGGRLATRRMEWPDREGRATTTALDHGALGFACRSAAFQAFADAAVASGCLRTWSPTLAAGSLPLEERGPLYIGAPDMPALCRHMLNGLPARWSFAVDSLQRGPNGWQLRAGDGEPTPAFDAVVLALPPAQAAPLLQAHRADRAWQASLAWMQPCWTLMGVADETQPEPDWDLAQPATGPLAWVLRNDQRPGRARVPGQAHWVVHARAGWSRQHLEQPAAWVQQQMQAALAEWLGRPVDWHHCTVHRWRYAMPRASGSDPIASGWWDAAQGLGVCGDFLGGHGVEGAWLSAQALAAAASAALAQRLAA